MPVMTPALVADDALDPLLGRDPHRAQHGRDILRRNLPKRVEPLQQILEVLVHLLE